MGFFGDRIKSAKGAILGQQGEFYTPGDYNNVNEQLLNEEITFMRDPALNEQLAKYQQGQVSLSDLLNTYGKSAGHIAQLASSPVSGMKFASEQVQSDPILKQIFGKGGSFERADTEEQELAKRGYTLQPEDFEAYGQAQDQIARQFGASEQSLAQALANRGMAGGGGVAASQFSGMYGNKNERLRAAQTDIAQRRMEMNRQRLNDTRSYLNSTGQLGNQAINDNRQANMQGVELRQGLMERGADRYSRNYGMNEGLKQASIESKAANYQPGFFDSVHAGANKGAGNFAQSFMSGGFMGGGGGAAAGASGGGNSSYGKRGKQQG